MGLARVRTWVRWSPREDTLLALALALFTVLHSLVDLDLNPYFSVDEGWLLQVPRNLLTHGLYGTITLQGPVPFASEITTGPAVLLPSTLAFALLGDGLSSARLVSVAYAGFAAAAAYGLLRLTVDRAAAVLAVLVFSLSLYPYNRAALGEMGGLAWVLAGAWFWLRSGQSLERRGLGIASACFALASLCKVSLAPITGLALVITWALDRRRSERRFPVIWLAAPLGAMTVGNGVWYAVQYLTLGHEAFLTTAVELASYQPQTAAWSSAQLLHNPMVLLYALPDGLLPMWGAAVLFAPWHALRGGLRNPQYTLPFLLFSSALLFFILSIGWPRYGFWATALGALFAGWLVQPFTQRLAALRPTTDGYRWAGAVALLAAALVGPPSVSARDTLEMADDSARQTARVLAAGMTPHQRLGSTEWEIDFLARRPALHPPGYRLPTTPDVLDSTFDWGWSEADWLVLGQLGRAYGAEARLERSGVPWRLERRIGAYSIYRRVALLESLP